MNAWADHFPAFQNWPYPAGAVRRTSPQPYASRAATSSRPLAVRGLITPPGSVAPSSAHLASDPPLMPSVCLPAAPSRP
jgi:hypothetical protein